MKDRPGWRAGKRLWSTADDARLRRVYPHMSTAEVARRLRRTVSAISGRVQCLGLRKSAAYLASPAACRLRRGDNVGAAFRFQKGHVPANKGVRRPGWYRGRMRETQFQKGHRSRWMPVGATRVADGYVYRKMSDIPNVSWTKNWQQEHLRIWTAAHGAVPPKHVVSFRNRNRFDIRLENLECITRAAHMARNTIHNLPPALKATVRLLASVNRQIRKRGCHDAEHD